MEIMIAKKKKKRLLTLPNHGGFTCMEVLLLKNVNNIIFYQSEFKIKWILLYPMLKNFIIKIVVMDKSMFKIQIRTVKSHGNEL